MGAVVPFFPELFAIHALAPNVHSVPTALYLPWKKNVEFSELTSPFGCGTTYVTKSALQRHRVRMYKFKCTPKDLPNEQFFYIPLFDYIVEIVRHAN